MPDLPSASRKGGLAILILLLAIGQIAFARLTVFLHIGVGVELRSAATTHPLVPLGYAFAIWGVIYLYSLIASVCSLVAGPKVSRAVGLSGGYMAAVYLINCLWQVWVPLYGLDWVSCALIAISLAAGLTGLMRLRTMPDLSRLEQVTVFGPLALVTGWITAAAFVNVTSALIFTHVGPDPRQVTVSAIALVALVVFGGIMVLRIRHSLYALALVWALFWILMANIRREPHPQMVWIAGIGIILVVGIQILTMRKRHLA